VAHPPSGCLRSVLAFRHCHPSLAPAGPLLSKEVATAVATVQATGPAVTKGGLSGCPQVGSRLGLLQARAAGGEAAILRMEQAGGVAGSLRGATIAWGGQAKVHVSSAPQESSCWLLEVSHQPQVVPTLVQLHPLRASLLMPGRGRWVPWQYA
jgi:hypothetical protein